MEKDEIIDPMESFCEMIDCEDFDFTTWVNEAFLRKSFMWDIASWPIFRLFLGKHYEMEIIKMALVWSEASDQNIIKWARYCYKNGLVMSKFQVFKKFFTIDSLIEIGESLRKNFTKMLEDLPTEGVFEDNENFEEEN